MSSLGSVLLIHCKMSKEYQGHNVRMIVREWILVVSPVAQRTASFSRVHTHQLVCAEGDVVGKTHRCETTAVGPCCICTAIPVDDDSRFGGPANNAHDPSACQHNTNRRATWNLAGSQKAVRTNSTKQKTKTRKHTFLNEPQRHVDSIPPSVVLWM